MPLPGTIERTIEVQVPRCAQHDNGVSLRIDGKRGVASFRSVAYWRAFMAANDVDEPWGPRIHPPNLDRSDDA